MRGNIILPQLGHVIIYFNSRLCMRGNTNGRKWHNGRNISIHASAWEATSKNISNAIPWIFQFTPLHERQHKSKYHAHLSLWFQFTPLHERQQQYAEARADGDSISIHASAWEATTNGRKWHNGRNISIHASAWEATAKIHNLFDKIYIILYQTLFFL